MSKSVWYWTEGDKRIYTGRCDIVQKALRKGFFVEIVKDRPHVFRKAR